MKLGILAHSVEGAALCLREFTHRASEQLGPHDHPDVVLDCIAMGPSLADWAAGELDVIRATLARSATALTQAGADFFVCPDNTAHLALERPGKPLPLPGLHIAEVVADRAAALGYRTVGVLGTAWTMESDLYSRAFGRRGIAAVTPPPPDRALVDRVIFDELCNGVFTAASREQYGRIIDALAGRGCDAVALVCTEIPLLLDDESSPLPTLDSTRLLAAAACATALGDTLPPIWTGGPEVGKADDVGI